ncbi:hypothetical protein [Bradyrhizobium erythrophlei]|jgi:hypothetical protein|uniref:Uncharacterized protein n=1 Tax=Bradyrhizobium erythrophlei TaxID=1437360 RepID=A0A1M5QH65_9BRAD|nr:hypothetical protein [Bradyrhizobium erythrophlei]SHH13457.1 hypothetical protein SAMN05443248_3811 [Bradyrhizobium erythrophlei]
MSGRQKHKKLTGQFAPRPIDLLRSPAYRVLSLSGHRVLARIEIEFADHGGTDNGRLPVTYVDFEDFGIDRHAIGPAINECEALGLIEVTERGRSGNAEFRTPSLYRLTYRYTDKAGPSDEWRRYDTIEQAKAVATVARQSSVERSRRKRGHRMPPPLREAS